MKLYKKIPMSFEDKAYEIGILYDDAVINVVTFLDNHPANGLRHQIKLPKKCSVLDVLKQNIGEKLVEIARDDIIENRWESISQTIQQNMIE